LNIKLLKLRKR